MHPYNDLNVIAGQGTISYEMLSDCNDIDILLVPVVGGGLIAGCSLAAKAMNQNIKVIGIESELYPSLTNIMFNKKMKCKGSTLAEGIAVSEIGQVPLSFIKNFVDDVITVSDKSTADPVSYTIPTSITMPANSNVASLQIDVEDINIISSRVLILKLEEKSGLFIGNDNEFTINLLRICVSDIAGAYTYGSGKPATVTETSPNNYEVSGDGMFNANYPFNINDACDEITVTGGFLPDAYGIPIAGAGMVMPDGSLEITYTVDGYFEERPMVLIPN